MKLTLDPPWLVADFERPLRIVSWALNRPGFVTANRIVWREVRNADLPEGFDAKAWFRDELRTAGQAEAVGFLTSRDIRRHTLARAEIGGVSAEAIATVGLSNAERVGSRLSQHHETAGTINIAVVLSAGLSDAALLEGLSIAAEARTAAVITHGPTLPSGPATGTGTDCIAVAAPTAGPKAPHAGKHTEIGEVLGRAVLDAITRGVKEWIKETGGG
ncbi:MAG: adenosylcobinamide amidohydrolase [Pseudomonadota bacterium]